MYCEYFHREQGYDEKDPMRSRRERPTRRRKHDEKGPTTSFPSNIESIQVQRGVCEKGSTGLNYNQPIRTKQAEGMEKARISHRSDR
jgi:hypothetical protein